MVMGSAFGSMGGTTEMDFDEKCSMSRAMVVTCSYVVGNQEPPMLSVWAMGHFSRSSSQMVNGSAMYCGWKTSYSVDQSSMSAMAIPLA